VAVGWLLCINKERRDTMPDIWKVVATCAAAVAAVIEHVFDENGK